MLLSQPQALDYDPFALISTDSSYTQWTPVKWILRVYQNTILRMIAHLYLYGPQIAGFGFWQGKAPEDICAVLTNGSAAFWTEHSTECIRLITQHFYSWVVLFEMCLCMILLHLIYKIAVK